MLTEQILARIPPLWLFQLSMYQELLPVVSNRAHSVQRICQGLWSPSENPREGGDSGLHTTWPERRLQSPKHETVPTKQCVCVYEREGVCVSVCMYMYVCMCVYVYECVYMSVSVHVCVYECVYGC